MIIYTAPTHAEKDLAEQMEKANMQAIRVEHASWFGQYPNADLYIDGAFEGYFADVSGPYLFHSPVNCLSEFPKIPAKGGRICAWPGFWERTLWEIAIPLNAPDIFSALLSTIDLKTKIVPDKPGFIAARILSTLINEAAYTTADGVAVAEDIDIAMELGTNYPMGPVAWGRKIGLKNIRMLLEKLALEDSRYKPHPKLEEILQSKT